MKISREDYNKLKNKLEKLEAQLNAGKANGGGNPYHDALGRFTSGPSKAFGKYNPSDEDVYNEIANNGIRVGLKIKDEDRMPNGVSISTTLENADAVDALARTQLLRRTIDQGNNLYKTSQKAIDEASGTPEVAVIADTANKVNQHIYDAINSIDAFAMGIGMDSQRPGDAAGLYRKAARNREIDDINRSLNLATKYLDGRRKKMGVAGEKFANEAWEVVETLQAATNTLKYLSDSLPKGVMHDVFVEKPKAKAATMPKTTTLEGLAGMGYIPKPERMNSIDRLKVAIEKLENGGKGSGNFGHSGRPGKVGGSGGMGSGGAAAKPRDAGPTGVAVDYINIDPRGAYADGAEVLDTAQDYLLDKIGSNEGVGENIAMAYEDDARDFLGLPSRDEENEGAEMYMSDLADLQDRITETIKSKSWDELKDDLGEGAIESAFDFGLTKGGYDFAKTNAKLGQSGLSHEDAVRDLKSFIADFGIGDHYGAIKTAESGDLKTAWQNVSYEMRDKLRDDYDYDPMEKNSFKGATRNVSLSSEQNGGKGSGNFGHSGRPGKVGGSGQSSAGSLATGRMLKGVKEYDPENEIDGGFTVDLKDGKAYRLGKSEGYAVGGYGTEKVVDMKDWNDKATRRKILNDYMKANKKALSQEGACLGGWVPNKGSTNDKNIVGKVVLDVSRVFKDKKDAAKAAIKFDQDSITDFKGFDWPTKEQLAKEFGLEKELKKASGKRAAERAGN